MSKIRLSVVLVGGVLALAGAVACGGGATPAPSPTVTTAPTRPTAPTTRPTVQPTSPPSSSAPPVSAEQRNATQAAQDYLASGQHFSRKGLIRQLSSAAGEGYAVKAATAAVDSLHIDFNEQAALSAKDYLDTGSFSRSGLIKQLTSGAEGFTKAQATYGVKKAGL